MSGSAWSRLTEERAGTPTIQLVNPKVLSVFPAIPLAFTKEHTLSLPKAFFKAFVFPSLCPCLLSFSYSPKMSSPQRSRERRGPQRKMVASSPAVLEHLPDGRCNIVSIPLPANPQHHTLEWPVCFSVSFFSADGGKVSAIESRASCMLVCTLPLSCTPSFSCVSTQLDPHTFDSVVLVVSSFRGIYCILPR